MTVYQLSFAVVVFFHIPGVISFMLQSNLCMEKYFPSTCKVLLKNVMKKYQKHNIQNYNFGLFVDMKLDVSH
jgi:hypothetical protein